MQVKILKFKASWCQPCKMLTQVIAGIELPDHVKVEEIDVDEHPDLAQKYNIRNIPVLVKLEDGVETGRKIGSMSATQFENFVGI